MELTYEQVEALRKQGLSWRTIGFHLAHECGGDAYQWQERARRKYRRYGKKDVQTSVCGEKKEEVTPHPQSEEELLKAHGYDPKLWRVVDSSCSLSGASVSSRVKVAPKNVTEYDIEALVKEVVEALKEYHTPHQTDPELGCGDDMVVVPLYDLHFGRYHEGRDLHDTEARVRSAVQDIVMHLYGGPDPSLIVLPIGQDFLNSDTPLSTTTRGTPQDTAVPWHEMFSRGLVLALDIIEDLRQVAPVKVVYSMGNHDEVLSYAIVKAIKEHYHGVEDVFVDDGIQNRKYLLHGGVAVGLTHGSEESSLKSVMQMENPVLWGRTTERYWLTGHLHHLEMDEHDGVTIIRCPSLAEEDEWTRKKGFVGSRKSLMMLRFDKNEGLKEMWFAHA